MIIFNLSCITHQHHQAAVGLSMNLFGDVDYNGTLYVDSRADNDWVSFMLQKLS